MWPTCQNFNRLQTVSIVYASTVTVIFPGEKIRWLCSLCYKGQALASRDPISLSCGGPTPSFHLFPVIPDIPLRLRHPCQLIFLYKFDLKPIKCCELR